VAIVYVAVQQGRNLGVYPAPPHVAVLRHRHFGVPQLIGADPGGQAGVVDHRGHRLAER
jgi:hypothetical protein